MPPRVTRGRSALSGLGTFDNDDKGREGISYSLTDSSVLTGWKEGLGPKKKPLEPELKPFL